MKWFVLASLLLSTFASVQAQEVKLLSWNVFMLPAPIKRSLQSTRTVQIAKSLKHSDYDVVVLQEAFMKSFRHEIKKELHTNYPYRHYLKNNPKFPRIFGSGVYLLSKHPFKVLKQVYFKNCATADCGASKGSFVAEFTLGTGKQFQIAGTHLQAERKYANVRMKQLKQINDMFQSVQKADVPQMLIGDLNIQDKDPEFQAGLDLLKMDFVRLEGSIDHTGGIKNECYATGGDGVNTYWIDHIWANQLDTRHFSMQVKPMPFIYKGKSCELSDHHAVEAKITLL